METTTITTEKPIASVNRPFIKINAFLPLQIIKLIPNDDLSEIYLKSRVFSFIGWSLLFTLLTFILVQFAGVDKLNALYTSIALGVGYFLMRIAMAAEESNKLLSEEVEMKLRKVDSIKALVESHAKDVAILDKVIADKIKLLEIQQVWVDDSLKKADAFEAKCKQLETKNANQITKIEELQYQMEVLNKEVKFLDESSMKAKIEVYDLATNHTKELIAIERSTAQKIGDEKRIALEARLVEIENERKEMLGLN